MAQEIRDAAHVLILTNNEYSALNSLLYSLADNAVAIRSAGPTLGSNEVEIVAGLWENLHKA